MDNRIKNAIKKYWFLWLVVLLMAANFEVVQRNSPVLLAVGASMFPTMSFANLVFVEKQTSFFQLEDGDIIAFKWTSTNGKQISPFPVVHRVWLALPERGFIQTIGDSNWKECVSITQVHESGRDSPIVETIKTPTQCATQSEDVYPEHYIGKVYFWIPLEPIIVLALALFIIKKRIVRNSQ